MHKKEVKNFVRCLPKSRLPGRFFRFQARNSFQAKPEQKPKEDLRKRSKY